jgi:hypothetical protein
MASGAVKTMATGRCSIWATQRTYAALSYPKMVEILNSAWSQRGSAMGFGYGTWLMFMEVGFTSL